MYCRWPVFFFGLVCLGVDADLSYTLTNPGVIEELFVEEGAKVVEAALLLSIQHE